MIDKFLNALKNKYLLAILLILNVIIFSVGAFLHNTDLMILAALSFASVLISIEINNNGDRYGG